MKIKFINPIISFLSLFLLMNCDDAELFPKEYPYVVMEDVITSISGAKFIAKVYTLGNQKILFHGFVWGTHFTPKVEDDDHEYITSKLTIGSLVMEINSGLKEGQIYFVRPFIQTENVIVYGSALTFTSKGSNPPEIHDFQPKFGPVGTPVEISGKNFGFSRQSNTVKFGDYTAEIDSVTKTKIYVKVPKVTEPGKVTIKVETAGMTVNSIDKFDLYFPWQKLQEGHNVGPFENPSFTIDLNTYIINGNSNLGFKFNSVTKDLQSFSLPESSGWYTQAFAVDKKGYVLFENSFYEFDPTSSTWTRKADFPESTSNKRYAFTFSSDQMGFVGFCYKSQSLWSYNPGAGSWIKKTDFPKDFTQTTLPVWGKFSFSIENKGYLGISRSVSLDSFWEYDTNLDTWLEKSILPSNAYGAYACMVIDGNAYVGLGQNFVWEEGYVSDQIWRYDRLNDSWQQYQNCPKRLAVSASFGIGFKGYVLSEFTKYDKTLKEIWEFDPRKN